MLAIMNLRAETHALARVHLLEDSRFKMQNLLLANDQFKICIPQSQAVSALARRAPSASY
jgi:hypothetical protein